MGRKGRIFSGILKRACQAWAFLAWICSGTGCVPESHDDAEGRTVRISVRLAGQEVQSKGYEEDMTGDVSLLVFNQDGLAERCITNEDGGKEMKLDLILGRTYSFHALAGFGTPVFADHIGEMDELTYHIGDPYEAETGQVMSGSLSDVTISKNPSVIIPMKRMTAMISVGMDRSRLSEDVDMEVTGISIGNCPKQATVFRYSRVGKGTECFTSGYTLRGTEVSPLNLEDRQGRSGKVSLFMLENMQGDITDMDLRTDSDKVFGEEDARRETCSYLEVQMKYMSHSHFSSEGPLTYRFYLGDGLDNVDVERNCRYDITISPEGDGLSEDSWRVDKTYMHEFGASHFASFPESYIRGNIGDTLHLYCEFYPPYTPFEIDMEELEYDRRNGIYDYIIDEDGHGVRLTLTGAGTGIVYMEAGEPVNEAAMWVVEVNRDTSRYMSPCRTSTAPECPQRPGVRLHRLPPGQGLSPSPPHG